MDIFIAYCNDRHIDPVIRAFTTPELAIAFADAFIVEQGRVGTYDADFNLPPEWLYYRQFSCEGDHVHVEKSTLDNVDTHEIDNLKSGVSVLIPKSEEHALRMKQIAMFYLEQLPGQRKHTP